MRDQQLPLASPVMVIVEDLPALREEQVNKSGVYVGVVNTDPEEDFRGAAVDIGTDDGTETGTIQTEATQGFRSEAIAGNVVGTCGGGVTGRFWDTKTTLVVTLMRNDDDAQLSSAPEEQVWGGKANVLLVGREIIGFVNAVATGNAREWSLTKLARGLRATEAYINVHAENEQVTMLTGPSALQFVPIATEKVVPNVGAPNNLKARAVPTGLPMTDSVYTKVIPYEAKPRQEFPPAVAPSVRDADGNVTINWLPRSKHPFRLLAPIRDDILTCCWDCEEYLIEILSSDRSTVLRRFRVLKRRDVIYTAERQVTDFGSTQSSIQINIYKMGQLLGPGLTDGGTA